MAEGRSRSKLVPVFSLAFGRLCPRMRGERTSGKVGRREPSREDPGTEGQIPERASVGTTGTAGPRNLILVSLFSV